MRPCWFHVRPGYATTSATTVDSKEAVAQYPLCCMCCKHRFNCDLECLSSKILSLWRDISGLSVARRAGALADRGPEHTLSGLLNRGGHGGTRRRVGLEVVHLASRNSGCFLRDPPRPPR